MRVEDAAKDFWATRPRRPRRGRKIAGVATGIANRYRIDPVLVRVAFVVAAIYGGAGVVLYLLGWLFLPEQDDEVSPIESMLGKGRSSMSTGFTLLLCLLMLPVLGGFLSGSFTGEFSSWFSLLVMGGLLFMLHQARGHLTPVTPAPPGGTPNTETPVPPSMAMPMTMPTSPLFPPPPGASAGVPTTPPTGAPVGMTPPPEERTTPPAWDPLGAAPFAWDLPEPTTPEEPEEPEPPVKRRKPKVATATIGIALMAVAGLSIAASETMGPSGWITPQHIVGVALAIVGLGMVAGAMVRSGRGLIAIAVPLSVVGMGLTSVSPGGYDGYGDMSVLPLAVVNVRDSYERSIGDIELDLSRLPASGVVTTEARTDIGNVTVIVPETADVVVTCETERGHAICLGEESSGMGAKIEEYTDFGSDGAGGLQIELTAKSDTGNVEVRRG